MSKVQVKDFVLLMFWGILGILLLYWVMSYEPSGDFFRLDEPIKNEQHDATKYDNKRFKALTKGFKEGENRC